MSRFDKYDESQLHKIIIHSVDVLPDQVKFYLKELAESKKYNMIKILLLESKDFNPLVNAIPKEFVDFILDVLIEKTISNNQNKTYGINDIYFFSPPFFIQGPFFYLLLSNENEGLRLIHSLVNVASAKWCEYQRQQKYDRPRLTPLPVKINFLFGSRQFWGNTQVYCWFRGETDGPDAVISALMSLEVWMEKQIENGRDVEELFEVVCKDSDSVAVLGICISLTLAYPQKCLRAALPIVSSPAIWSMDIQRSVNDRIGRVKLPFEKNDWAYKLLERHDQKPHRQLDIHSLAIYYLFCSNESLRISFEQAVSEFTENLPFKYQEEKEDPATTSTIREQMENHQAFGKKENFRFFKNGNNLHLEFQQPDHIKKRNEKELAFDLEYQRWLRMKLWSRQAVEKNDIENREDLEEMVKWAKEFKQLNHLVGEDPENFYDNLQLEVIASVAAAALIVDFEWMKAQDLLQWSKNILMSAPRVAQPSVYTRPLCKFDVFAARGLATLVAHKVADLEARQQVLLLVGKSSKQFNHSYEGDEVLKALFLSLQAAWTTDPVVCWNALSLCLSLFTIPVQIYHGNRIGEFETSYEELEAWENNIIQSHLIHLEKNKIPDLPRVPAEEDIVFVYERVKYGLDALPLTELCQDHDVKNKLLQLFDDLISRIIIDSLPLKDRRFSYVYIFSWAAYLARSLSLEEIRHHILTPLRNNWAKFPALTAALLDGYIMSQIAYIERPSEQALEIWKEICTWVLDSPEIPKKVSHDYLDYETGEILQLIIFIKNGYSHTKDDWQYANLFVDVFDKWVGVVGHNPYAYGHLLTMIEEIGLQFLPEPTLKWISLCARNATHNLWNEERRNGSRTAKLLHRIWSQFETQIRKKPESLHRYADLIYRLVGVGVPLASVLQKKLEERE